MLFGYNNIQNVAIDIRSRKQPVRRRDDEFHVAIAKILKEACKLLEVGFG